MDIRGLILVNTGMGVAEEQLSLSSFPLPLLDTAGKTALERVGERLRQYGIEPVTVVAEAESPSQSRVADAKTIEAAGTQERFWRAAENAFNEMVQNGAELVVLLNMGAYAEVDFEKLLQFHLDQQARVTQVYHRGEPLEIFCISASRRNDAASLFRSQLLKCRSECPGFDHHGYVNHLRDPRDLRQLAIDILTLKTETRPAGEEARPGVWIRPGAIVEKGARILAPAFIGTSARISSGAVITRCSSIEHHARIDCGTVVENSTVLPGSYVGAGLDLSHSVVGMKKIANLRRNASIEVADPKLIGLVSASAGKALFSAAVELATFLPMQIWRGWFGKAIPQQPDLQTALQQTSPSLGKAAGYQTRACDTNAAGEFPPDLAIVRRYGDQ